MLGNEAIVRGAVEADVKVVTFHPGASTLEILDTFSEAPGNFDYQMRIATNEKAAYGHRSLSWPRRRAKALFDYRRRETVELHSTAKKSR